MCVIVYKDRGIELPTDEVLKNCFTYNPDGAGILLGRRGTNIFEIHKGYLTWESFLKIKNDLNIQLDDLVVFHFRITTSGGTSGPNCHPFPISDKIEDLTALRIDTKRALVHNGVLGKGDSELHLSDTQMFIRETLSNPLISNNLENQEVYDALEKVIGSNKFIITDADKNVCRRIGAWQQDTTTKIWFSNKNHEWKSNYNYGSSYSNKDYYNYNWNNGIHGAYQKRSGYFEKYNNYYQQKYSKIDQNKNNITKDKLFDYENSEYVYYPRAQRNITQQNSVTPPPTHIESVDCPQCGSQCTKLIKTEEIYICDVCYTLFNNDTEEFWDNDKKKWENFYDFEDEDTLNLQKIEASPF